MDTRGKSRDMAIFGYARVSTNDQTVERQIRELQAAGAETVYADTGVSGSLSSRPELDRMLEHLRPGDEVMVTELSRIARSSTHLQAIVERFEKLGVSFRCLNVAGLDFGTAFGKAFLTIMGVMAQLERDLTIERINSGLQTARAQGRVGGRPKAMNTAAIAKAKALRAKDVSVNDIAKTLGVSRATVYNYLG